MNFTQHETRLRVGHDKVKDNDRAVTLINFQDLSALLVEHAAVTVVVVHFRHNIGRCLGSAL